MVADYLTFCKHIVPYETFKCEMCKDILHANLYFL